MQERQHLMSVVFIMAVLSGKWVGLILRIHLWILIPWKKVEE